jgi:two-component system OmpR family response regulator
LRILLIEDDAETADYIAKGLTEQGHLIARAGDGNDALLAAMSETFDLLIVDRMIPGLDGLKLVRTLRSAGHEAPVLFLTAGSRTGFAASTPAATIIW